MARACSHSAANGHHMSAISQRTVGTAGRTAAECRVGAASVAIGDKPLARKITIFGRHFRMPRSRWLRILIGIGLIVLGIFGFLPVLGFWMVPLGLLVLSYEFHLVAACAGALSCGGRSGVGATAADCGVRLRLPQR